MNNNTTLGKHRVSGENISHHHSGSLQCSRRVQTFTSFTFLKLYAYAKMNCKKPNADSRLAAWKQPFGYIWTESVKYIILRYPGSVFRCGQNHSLRSPDTDEQQLCTWLWGYSDILPFTLLLERRRVWVSAELSGLKSGLWLENTHRIVPKPLLCCLGRVLRVIVLLGHEPLAHFKVLSPLD